MKLHEPQHRAPTPSAGTVSFCSEFIVLSLLILLIPGQPGGAQHLETATVAVRAPLTAEQVVQNLVQMNLLRVQALRTYHGTRTYRAEYHGFPGARSAEMVVKVSYISPGEKGFMVQSTTGSSLIIDKVFKKLLEAEQEALNAEIQRRSALTEDNYRFTLIRYENGPSGARYVLKVEPRAKDKFLYSGRIWVDAEDFAVVRLGTC